MYYQECERLAFEQPNLAALVQKIDERIHGLNPGSVLRTDIFAKVLNESRNR